MKNKLRKIWKNNNELESNSKENKNWSFSNSLYETFIGTDAGIFITEWEEFQNLDWTKIAPQMRKPAWIFDTRSILDMDEVKEKWY